MLNVLDEHGEEKEELIQGCKPQLPFFLRLHVQPSTFSQNTHPAGELQSPKCKASSFKVKIKQTGAGVSSKQSSLLVKRTAKALRSIRALAALKWTKNDPRLSPIGSSPHSEERQPE